MIFPDWEGTGTKEWMADFLPRFGLGGMSKKRECPRGHRWCPVKKGSEKSFYLCV